MSTRTADRPASARRAAIAGSAGLLLGLAAAAWLLTDARMAGMDAGPGSDLGDVGWFAAGLPLMMAAMMLPAVAPMVVALGRRSATAGAPVAFAVAYLTTWVAAGMAGYAGVEGVRSLHPGFLAWDGPGRYVAGAVIVAAGLYQLTDAKAACLARCRAVQPARCGARLLDALRMGLGHGASCIACCWALMAVLLALGAMSVTWMAFVAAVIAAERLLPRADAARFAVAVVLVALGTAVALAPHAVPGLTVPGSPMAMGQS